MADDLREVVISDWGAAIRRSSTDVPEYLKKAIADSVERGVKDAHARRPPVSKKSSQDE